MKNDNQDELSRHLESFRPERPDISIGEMMFEIGRQKGAEATSDTVKRSQRVWKIAAVSFAAIAVVSWLPHSSDESSQPKTFVVQGLDDQPTDEDTATGVAETSSSTANNALIRWFDSFVERNDIAAAFRQRNEMIRKGVEGLPEMETVGYFGGQRVLTPGRVDEFLSGTIDF